MSKRKQFRKLRDLKDNLKKYNAFSVDGYFPLFNNIDDAIFVSPEADYHTHELQSVEYYMPNGLGGPGSGLQFHGDYKEQITQNVDNDLEQEEQLPPIPQPTPESLPPPPIPLPTPLPTPAPTPSPIRRVNRGGTGGGGY